MHGMRDCTHKHYFIYLFGCRRAASRVCCCALIGRAAGCVFFVLGSVYGFEMQGLELLKAERKRKSSFKTQLLFAAGRALHRTHHAPGPQLIRVCLPSQPCLFGLSQINLSTLACLLNPSQLAQLVEFPWAPDSSHCKTLLPLLQLHGPPAALSC
jgi:hypothetical protein